MWKIILLVGILFSVHSANSAFDTASRYDFTCDICHRVGSEKPHENFIMSPASVQTCMALVYMGAEGKTADELKRGLHLEKFSSKNDVAKDYGEFLQTSTKGEHSKLLMANRMYIGEGYDIAPEFNDIATKHFSSRAEVVNFKASKETADKINSWVQSETKDKITNLIDSSSLTEDTAAILVNAIYFKAEWNDRFDPTYTKDLDFTSSEKKVSKVPTMYKPNAYIRYAEYPKYDMTAVELKYKDTDLKMLIMLPNKADGLEKLEQSLNVADWLELDGLMKETRLDIFIPKFRIEFDTSLVETFKKMGINDVFSHEADLSGLLISKKPLQISEVKHKAFIEVDENGSEAAGAAYAQATERIARLDDSAFRADHPFLFAIQDSKAVYFCGHVVKL